MDFETTRSISDAKSLTSSTGTSSLRGSEEIDAVSLESSGSHHDDIRELTTDPSAAQDKVIQLTSKERPEEAKLPSGLKAFFDRHPLVRLFLAGAVVVAAALLVVAAVLAIAAAIGVTATVLAGFAAAATGIAAYALPALVIGMCLVGGVVVVSSLAVSCVAASKGGSAISDMMKWREFKQHLKEGGAPKEDIRKAHRYFHSRSRVPVEILIQHDTKLSALKKTELIQQRGATSGQPLDRERLYRAYLAARRDQEAPMRRVPVNDLPGLTLIQVAGAR